MRIQGSRAIQIEIELLGGSVEELKSELDEAGLGRLWMIIESSFEDQSLTLGRAAKAANVSSDHMNDTLRRACGLTFKQLLIRMRLLAAARTLESKPCTRIDGLAASVGFGDPSSFRKQFKRHLGSTPRAFKKN